jgi:hypothetical protein
VRSPVAAASRTAAARTVAAVGGDVASVAAHPTGMGMNLDARLRRAERLGHTLANLPVTAPRAGQPSPARPAAAAPPASATAATPAPIQMFPGWKKALGAGMAGVVGLGVGAAMSMPLLAGAGALALGGGLAYGGAQLYKQRQATRRREALRRRQKELREADPLADQELHGNAEIPSSMHFIWLGGQLPKERMANIQDWQGKTKGVKHNLWVDSNSAEASSEHLETLRKTGVNIRHIDELNESERFARARQQLPTRDERGVNGGAAAAVSDLARLEILNREGGHYMDSDNTPGPQAGRFANMRTETGLRLGFSPIEKGNAPTFSNDAMSAMPGERFIRGYLDHSYEQLNERSIAGITSRDPEQVKTAVMSTTGPEAMAAVPLPVRQDEVTSVAGELESAYPDTDRVDIRTFSRSNAMNENMGYHPTVKTLLNRFGYGRGLFNRGLGNSWVGNKPASGEDEGKKTK